MIRVLATFLDTPNPDQLEIVRFRNGDDDRELDVDGDEMYWTPIRRKP